MTSASKGIEKWYLYIVQCLDNSFYVGTSNDPEQRVKDHNKGKGSNYTRKRYPVKLVYKEGFENKKNALMKEKQIKKWSRNKKKALIDENFDLLKIISKSSK